MNQDKALPSETSIAIVGAGFGGIGMALELEAQGERDYVVLEADSDVGGTWRANRYPGCACDVPSHLYELARAPNPNWTRKFSGQDEIEAYLKRTVSEQGLDANIYCKTEVSKAQWESDGWTLTLNSGRRLRAKALALATGPLRKPKYPSLEGMASFAGETMHTARWRPEVDLRGKKIAVIGTGASAIQVIPELAKLDCELTVYQRTPPWILPRGDSSVSAVQRGLYKGVPGLQRLRRNSVFLYTEVLGSALLGNWVFRPFARQLAMRHLARQVPDQALRKVLTPNYEMGCKRVLLSDDYYPALQKPNVTVVDRAVARILPKTIVDTEGAERAADVLVYATGFDVSSFMAPLEVVGADGQSLAEAWKEGAAAYFGIFVPGFPNMGLVLGPNTGLGHSSVVLMAEAQIRYIAKALPRMMQGPLDVRTKAHQDFDSEMQRRLSGMVWNKGGCSSWYLDENGRNVTLWPGFVREYQRRTEHPRWEDFSHAIYLA